MFAISPWATPELGLTAGLVLGLTGLAAGADVGALLRSGSRWLIQIAVVLLGFRMDLHKVVSAGGVGLALAAGVVVVTFVLGLLLAKMLRTQRELGMLISSGTAICGGSAIAAVGATIRATGANIGVALGVVFILNAVSLYIFPQVGELLKMTPRQFGAWAGIAIHDVSSVVGAAGSFRRGTEDGALALETATVVKLARVLWIVPVCMVAAHMFNDQSASAGRGEAGRRIPGIPWYIPLFVAAAVLSTFIAPLAEAAPAILMIARSAMTLALFLIGAGLSRQALLSVGWRPLLLSAVLWVVIAVAALFVVMGVVD